MIMNLVKTFLNIIVSPKHTSFVEDQQILDRIITTHEVIQSLKNWRELVC